MRDCRLVVSHTFPSVCMSEPDWRLGKEVCIFQRPLVMTQNNWIRWWTCFTPSAEDLPFKCQVRPPKIPHRPSQASIRGSSQKKNSQNFRNHLHLVPAEAGVLFLWHQVQSAEIDEKKSILRTPDDVEKALDECELSADTHAHSCCFHFTMERFSLLKTSSQSAFPKQNSIVKVLVCEFYVSKGATAVIDEQKFSCCEFCAEKGKWRVKSFERNCKT